MFFSLVSLSLQLSPFFLVVDKLLSGVAFLSLVFIPPSYSHCFNFSSVFFFFNPSFNLHISSSSFGMLFFLFVERQDPTNEKILKSHNIFFLFCFLHNAWDFCCVSVALSQRLNFLTCHIDCSHKLMLLATLFLSLLITIFFFRWKQSLTR